MASGGWGRDENEASSRAGLRRGLCLADHTHAGLIYGSREEQVGTAAAFFQSGLSDRRCCVYVHDELDHARALQALAEAGLDVAAAMGSRSLLMADLWQLPAAPGQFSMERMFSFLRNLADGAEAAGYRGLRILGKMTWALMPDPSLERLTVYESRCTEFATTHPLSGICQYDRHRFTEQALFDVICTHPWLIVSGVVCQNPYYTPNATFAERERGTLDIGEILGNVLARERQEQWLSIAEMDLELDETAAQVVDVTYLAAIYENMRDYKLALRHRTRWRLDNKPGARRSMNATAELTALDAEIEWLEERASLWRRRELQSVGLYFDYVTGAIAYRGRALGLSRLEAALLRVLLDQTGRPCPASQLMQTAWESHVRTEAQLRNYIARLRDKLRRLQVPAAIVTERGRGYCLATGPVEAEETEPSTL